MIKKTGRHELNICHIIALTKRHHPSDPMKSYPAPVRPCGSIARYCSSVNPLLFLAGSLLLANVAFAQAKTHRVKYYWVTGEPLVYQNWGSNHDFNHEPDQKHFGGLVFGDGGWRCLTEQTVSWCNIAAYESDNSPPKDPNINWTQWRKSDGGNDHWYGLNMELRSWDKHKERAMGMQAYLATMTSAKEDKFVYSLAQKHFTNTFYAANLIFGIYSAEKLTVAPKGGYEKMNLTGRPLGTPPPIDRTSPTKSEPQQAQGSYTRQSLRIRTGLN